MNNHTIRRMLIKTFMRQWRFNGQKIFKVFLKDASPSSTTSLSSWANRGCYKGLLLEEPQNAENTTGARKVYLYMIKEDFDKMVNISPSDSSFNTLYGSTTAAFVDMSSGVCHTPLSVDDAGTFFSALFKCAVPVQDSVVKIRVLPTPLTSVSVTGVSAAVLDGCDMQLAPAQAPPTGTGSGIVLFAGGYDANNDTYYQNITKYSIANSNTAVSFGRLLDQSHSGSATGQTGGRGLFIGGKYPLFSSSINPYGGIEDIQYITFATVSNSSFFAELVKALYYTAAASNGDKVCVIGGASYFSSSQVHFDSGLDVVQYTSINTPANCSEFSQITTVKQTCCTSNGKLDTAIYAGGRYTRIPTDPFSSFQDYQISAMHRVTISTKVVSDTIGNLTQATYDAAMVSNGAGNTAVMIAGRCDTGTANIMEYTTITTGVSMSAFGVCDAGQATGGSNGSSNKAVFRQQGVISTITINTLSNAVGWASIDNNQYSMCNQDKID